MNKLAVCLLVLLSLGSPARSAAQASADAVPTLAEVEHPPRAGDVIRLQIWREPDLSGEFTIDEKGEVVLPRLGRVRVIEETPTSLEERLVRAYSKYLTHTSIDVTLLRRVQILGAVRDPGLYPVDATMSVADALALAGGSTPEGDPSRVELIRDGERIAVRLEPGSKITTARVQSGDQLFVPERSWLSRHTGIVGAGLTAGASLIIAFLSR